MVWPSSRAKSHTVGAACRAATSERSGIVGPMAKVHDDEADAVAAMAPTRSASAVVSSSPSNFGGGPSGRQGADSDSGRPMESRMHREPQLPAARTDRHLSSLASRLREEPLEEAGPRSASIAGVRDERSRRRRRAPRLADMVRRRDGCRDGMAHGVLGDDRLEADGSGTAASESNDLGLAPALTRPAS